MNSPLDSLIDSCDAIARLFAPHVEVVLHDLQTDTICHIANCFSKRRVGDSSLTDIRDVDLSQRVIGPYAKTNWDGRRLKSISTVIRNDAGTPVALMCINHNIEAFSQVLEQMLGLVAPPVPMPAATTLFASDWREKINELIGAFLAQHNTTVAGLNAADVEALIASLDRAGIFSIRNAVSYIADILGCSRATLYSRLKRVRSQPRSTI
jgi:D-arginine utilization repressor